MSAGVDKFQIDYQGTKLTFQKVNFNFYVFGGQLIECEIKVSKNSLRGYFSQESGF